MGDYIFKAVVWGGFVTIAGLLFLNHWGWAMKITNYLFYLLVILVLCEQK